MNKVLCAYALRLLAKKMRTTEEVRKKLVQNFHFYSELNEEEQAECKDEQIEEVMEYLEKQKLLDDKFFVRTYLEYELTTNFRGKFGYWNKLQIKGIDKSLFAKIWEELSPNELEMAEKLLENNAFRFERESDVQKKRMKIQRFLQGRGFNFDVIYSCC